MNHLLILPLILPLLAGSLLLVLARSGVLLQRLVAGASVALLLATAVVLFRFAAEGELGVYLVGDWPAPFGIVLVLDRLAALMLLVTAVLASGAFLHAVGVDRVGRNFHALFQFQLFGINGAFLTGDLFNLFVFFEVLLIASYGLLLYGGGADRTRAGFHYVVLNLIGSSLFLIALGLLYGVTGTLNMADLARVVRVLEPEQIPLAGASALLLLAVFGLKGAMLPLHFWLPPAYRSATAPVAALFAIMTKVGVYAIIRVYTLVFGVEAGALAGVAEPVLLVAALGTIAVGSLGVMAAEDLGELIGYLVIVSVGTLLSGVLLFSGEGLGAGLYYLVHTTLVTGGLFLLADLVRQGRAQGTRLVAGERPASAGLLASLFLLGAVAIIGLPPLSGLVGKLLILTAVQAAEWWLLVPVWTAVLGSSLFLLLGLSRAGGRLFWNGPVACRARPRAASLAGALLLLGSSPLLVLFGGGLTGYTLAAGRQLLDPESYSQAVLDAEPVAESRREETP